MESSSQDRNLPASQRKLQRAREQGQVARSRELSHLAVLGTGALALATLTPLIYEQLRHAFFKQLSFDSTAIGQAGDMLNRLQGMATFGLVLCVGFAAIVLTAVVLGSVASGGWVLSLKPLMPDVSRLNPLKGFAALFSKRKFAETAKLLVIIGVLLTVTASFLGNSLKDLPGMVLQPSPAAISYLANWLTGGIGLLLLVVLAVALIDVPLQNFLFKSELKMSQQEMKDEYKESEGNPQIKSKRREKQREIAQRGSIRSVPKADFVVMNPTHYAVAIQYDDQTMNAPRVISKGADLLAMKIRDIAKSHEIPVLQSPRLARALFANAELDQDIPATLYTAVAQVLAYVYRLKAALRGEGPMPDKLDEPFVPPELDPLARKLKAEAAAA